MKLTSNEDTGKSCKKRRSCTVCNEKHLETLHWLKVEGISSGNGANATSHSQNNNTPNATVVEDEQNEEICYNSTYTGSNVVSMRVIPVEINQGTRKFCIGGLQIV